MSLFSPFQLQNLDAYQAVQGATLSTDEGISNLVTSILPDYVVSDHPTFVAFLKAYFEYLEQDGNARFAASTIDKNIDVDQTLSEFLQYFKKQYLSSFPVQLESGMGERFILKKIKDYYQEKGSPRSIDLLFRILFGVSAEVELPREKLFVLSESDVDTRPEITLSNLKGIENTFDSESYSIKQRVTKDPTSPVRASAFLDQMRVVHRAGRNFIVADLLDLDGSFDYNLPVQIYDSAGNFHVEQIIPVFTKIVVPVGGTGKGFSANETLSIKDSDGRIIETVRIVKTGGLFQRDTTTGALIPTTANTGRILQLEDINMRVPDIGTYTIVADDGNPNTVELSLGQRRAISPKPDVYRSQKNLLSADSNIQDNNKYQQFSYVVKAEKSLRDYSTLLKKLFHPAGTKLFAQYNFSREFTLNSATVSSLAGASGGVRIRQIIAHYFPYTVGETADLRGDTFGVTFADYYPTGYNGLTVAALASFDAEGNAVTHAPTTAGFTHGPLGGSTAGTANPESFGFSFGIVTAGTVLPGYVVQTNQQLRATDSDSVTAPFFTIFRHPKNQRATNTIVASDADAYASGVISSDQVELIFDAQYDSIDNPHDFLSTPVAGDFAIQYDVTKFASGITVDDIRGQNNAQIAKTVSAFGTVNSVTVLPRSNPSNETRYYRGNTGDPPTAGRAFSANITMHFGRFTNTGYSRFPTTNQEGYVEFTRTTDSRFYQEQFTSKRFITQDPDFLGLNTTVASITADFAFQDVRVGDFIDNMTATLIVTSGTAGVSAGGLTG